MVASGSLRCEILLAFLCRWGASLLLSQDPSQTDMRTSETDVRTKEVYMRPFPYKGCNSTEWRRLLEPGAVRDQYENMLVRMQGKRFMFGGDSLMDMVILPIMCSAGIFGWDISKDLLIGEFHSRADESASTLAKILTKKDHEPIVVAYMRFYNYKFGLDNVKPRDVFFFPLTPPNFDVAFINMAHNAMFRQTPKNIKAIVGALIHHAHEATNVGRVVFLGHSPQHFKTETGEYAGAEVGDCMCHDKAALERQPIFEHNLIVETEVTKDKERSDGKCSFANPWSYYENLCRVHIPLELSHSWEKGAIDCTHWLEYEVAIHAPFLKDLLATAGI